jgi:hypothetical protein
MDASTSAAAARLSVLSKQVAPQVRSDNVQGSLLCFKTLGSGLQRTNHFGNPTSWLTRRLACSLAAAGGPTVVAAGERFGCHDGCSNCAGAHSWHGQLGQPTFFKLPSALALPLQPCSAGDTAPYERRASPMDDVVIVAAVRTPLTKVGLHASFCCMFTQACHLQPSVLSRFS